MATSSQSNLAVSSGGMVSRCPFLSGRSVADGGTRTRRFPPTRMPTVHSSHIPARPPPIANLARLSSTSQVATRPAPTERPAPEMSAPLYWTTTASPALAACAMPTFTSTHRKPDAVVAYVSSIVHAEIRHLGDTATRRHPAESAMSMFWLDEKRGVVIERVLVRIPVLKSGGGEPDGSDSVTLIARAVLSAPCRHRYRHRQYADDYAAAHCLVHLIHSTPW